MLVTEFIGAPQGDGSHFKSFKQRENDKGNWQCKSEATQSSETTQRSVPAGTTIPGPGGANEESNLGRAQKTGRQGESGPK